MRGGGGGWVEIGNYLTRCIVVCVCACVCVCARTRVCVYTIIRCCALFTVEHD